MKCSEELLSSEVVKMEGSLELTFVQNSKFREVAKKLGDPASPSLQEDPNDDAEKQDEAAHRDGHAVFDRRESCNFVSIFGLFHRRVAYPKLT